MGCGGQSARDIVGFDVSIVATPIDGAGSGAIQ